MSEKQRPSRRAVLGTLVSAAAAMSLSPASAQPASPIAKPIPSTGELIPCVGLGSWITFNVGNDIVLQDECATVIGAFFESGGRLINSSPMYGSSQAVIGYGLGKLGRPPALFAADKVWTSAGANGPSQVTTSENFWGVPRFDLLQVHNLFLSSERHGNSEENEVPDDFGISGSRHRKAENAEFERVMQTQPLDFVQITYNILDRDVEARILPLAMDRGFAVIVNRPFRQGALTHQLEHYHCRSGLPRSAHRAGPSSS